MTAATKLTLYTCYHSSCAARLHIALNLKELPTQCIHNHHTGGEHVPDDSRESCDSTVLAPLLTQVVANVAIANVSHSCAALEYLEECFSAYNPLLPPFNQPVQRAQVRCLVNITAINTQPFIRRSIVRKIKQLGSAEDWEVQAVSRGLAAYEKLAKETAGKYSVGDQMPLVLRIYSAMMELDAVQRAHWRRQKDTPQSERWL